MKLYGNIHRVRSVVDIGAIKHLKAIQSEGRSVKREGKRSLIASEQCQSKPEKD